MKLIKNEDGSIHLTVHIPNPEIEKWVIKYLDEPKPTRNRILHEAQNQLEHMDFCNMLEILLDATQSNYEKPNKNLTKNWYHYR